MDEILTELRKQREILESISNRLAEKFPTYAESKKFGEEFVESLHRSIGDDGISAYERLVARLGEVIQVQKT